MQFICFLILNIARQVISLLLFLYRIFGICIEVLTAA